VNHKRLSVSLVIPAYNEERHLAACLESIAAQTIAVERVIVVDNNSTDTMLEIARKYPFVSILKEPQQGIVFARNRGFDAVSSEIIGRIDADSILPVNWVEYVAAFFADPKHQQTAWTGSPYFYNVRFPRLVSGVYSFLSFRCNRFLAGSNTLWGSNMAIRASQWQTVREATCQRNDIHEDLDLAIHLHQRGIQITYDPKLRVHTQLRRVRTNRHELWAYLQWWPRTLRVHQKKTWIMCWFFGAFLLYYLTPLLNVAESIARIVGKKPLTED
jgi:glycosyltransferase involved in cell wall biosynthesis